MRLQKTVVIDKPRDAVFDYLSDFTTTTEWDPGTVVTVNQHGGDGGAGTTYLNTSTFLGRKTQLTRAAARSAVYEGGSLPGLMAVRVFAGHVVFL